MQNIILQNTDLSLEDQTKLTQINKGLIIVSNQNSGWIDPVVCNILHLMNSKNIEVCFLMEEQDEKEYFENQLLRPPNKSPQKVNFYGNLSYSDNLKQALKSAQTHLTLGYMRLSTAEEVNRRMIDILETANFDQSLIEFIISSSN